MNNAVEQIQKRIGEFMEQKEQVIVAIDGNCTAGKTTPAGILAEQYDWNVFHMDDLNSHFLFDVITIEQAVGV